MDGKCTLDNAGGAGSGGSSSTGEGGEGAVSVGGLSSSDGGDDSGPGSAGETNGSGAAGSGGTKNGSGANGSETPTLEARGKYGLVTGGGGCACRTAPSGQGTWAALLSLLALGTVVSRRRGGAKRRAA